ncbi:hypothetical protein BGZ63DRAFT_369589 [Mariannaea sp. PMI_226]|nr:hypothetical protein BGZ63DRAFT_369589 [Mariannaea sp. PMI_226]
MHHRMHHLKRTQLSSAAESATQPRRLSPRHARPSTSCRIPLSSCSGFPKSLLLIRSDAVH